MPFPFAVPRGNVSASLPALNGGSSSVPALAFASDPSSGVYHTDGLIGITLAGQTALTISNQGEMTAYGNVIIQESILGDGTLLTGVSNPNPLPQISNVVVTDSEWQPSNVSVLASSTPSQYFELQGSNFRPGSIVRIGATLSPKATYVSTSVLRVHAPTLPSGTYAVTIIRPDGLSTSSPITYSPFPTLSITNLGNVYWEIPFSTQINGLETTGSQLTYSVSTGSQLPTGTSLSSTGLFTGNIGTTQDVTYNFNVRITDQEQQSIDTTLTLNYRGIDSTMEQFNSLVGWYDGGSWVGGASKVWVDKSGSENHVVTVTGDVYTGTLNGYKTIKGSTSTTLLWPIEILPGSNYTFIHVCRYGLFLPGEYGTQRRIIQGYTQNWFSGFESAANGIRTLHGGAWITTGPTIISISDWVLSTDQLYSYRANGLNVTDPIISGTPVFDRLAINTGATGSQTSDFEIAEVLVFNSSLSIQEIEYVERYLNSKYGLREIHSGNFRVRYLRWSISSIRRLESEGADPFADDLVQVSEFQVLINGVWRSPTSATNTGWVHPTNNANENWTKLYDNNLSTKWVNSAWATTYVDFDLGSISNVQGYRWFTASDYQDRDPKSWTVSINAGGGWVTYDSVTNATVTTNRQALAYSFRSSSHLAVSGTVLAPKLAFSATDFSGLADRTDVTTWTARGEVTTNAVASTLGGGDLPYYDAEAQSVQLTGQANPEEPPNLSSASGTASGAGPFTLNGYVVQASSVWDTSGVYTPLKAFNKTNSNSQDCWHTQSGSTLPQWISIQFPTARSFTSYTIAGRYADSNSLPRSWRLEGSNNGSTWTTLDTHTNDTTIIASTTSYFTVTSPGSYLYYRLYFTASTGQYVSVAEWTFPGQAVGSYFDIPTPITWNLSTNFGFTFVGLVNFMSPRSNEKIFDFGSGDTINNLSFGRNIVTQNLQANLQDPNFVYTTTTNPIQTGVWQKVAARLKFTNGVNAWKWTIFYDNAFQETTATVAGVVSRYPADVWIGRSSSPSDSLSALALRELWWYDRPLTSEEIYTCFSLIDAPYGYPTPVFSGGTIAGATLYEMMGNMGRTSSEVPTAGGSLTFSGGATISSYDYTIFNTSKTISTFTNAEWFTSTQDSRCSLIKVFGDLTINAGVVMQPSVRKLFTVLYVTGDLYLNGEISMSSRGAKHDSPAIAAATIPIYTGACDESGTTVTSPYIPTAGQSGATAVSSVNGNVVGNPGGSATTQAARSTGGGGGGGIRQNLLNSGTTTGGAGSAGTSFGGGCGGGGAWSNVGGTAGSGVANGGTGGTGLVNAIGNNPTAGGGAGNPGGSGAGYSAASAVGGSGTGGVLVIFVKGTLYGSGSVTCNGANGGTLGVISGNYGVSGGGGSGGGSVTIITTSNQSTVTVSAVGGLGGKAWGDCGQGTCPGADGGGGGNGAGHGKGILVPV